MGKSKSPTQILRSDQYEFYSNWYHAAVRSIIGMYGFSDDYRWLAKIINPHITVTQAKRSVQLLERLGLIRRNEAGDCLIVDKSLTTGKDVMNVAFLNFHLACNDLAKRAFTAFPPHQRDMTGLTLGISEKTYERIREEIEAFQRKIMDLADNDEGADRVYQFDFNLFPMSNNDLQRKPS